jgi:cysteine desulfurase/selenocysteine lyase
MNLNMIRQQFPVTDHMIYLDNASRCPVCIPVAESQKEYIDFCVKYGSDYKNWWQKVDSLRLKLGKLINASQNEIGYASSTTSAMNIIARGYPWKEGDNIVLINHDFPSNIYPWLACKKNGVQIRFIEPNNGKIHLEQIKQVVDNNTRALSVSHVQAENGFRCDLDVIGDFCDKKKILFCVDATQSLGVFPIDVKQSHIDFLASSTYKWLMGSDGLAVFYCSDRIIDSVQQVFLGWSGRVNRNEFYYYPLDYPREARKFELGNPNFSSILALDAAVDFHVSIGTSQISNMTENIVKIYKQGINSINNVELVGDFDSAHQGAIITISLANADKIHLKLLKSKVACSLRHNGIRISPFFYNSEAESYEFLELLSEFVSMKG